MMRFAGIFTCVLQIFVTPALSQTPSPVWNQVQDQGQASLWVDRAVKEPWTLKLSESLNFLVRVVGEAPLQVELTQPAIPNDGWQIEMLGNVELTHLDDNKTTRWEQRIMVTPRKPGLNPLTMPGLQFTEKDRGKQSIAWKPLDISVTTSVAKADLSEVRDRTSIEELPQPQIARKPWWPWILALAALICFFAFTVQRRRRRHKPGIPPHLAALKALDQLSETPPVGPDNGNHIYTALSDILRKYLEQRFSLPATSRTTQEFFSTQAQASPLQESQREALDDILKQCDLGKFAGIGGAKDQCQQIVSRAREFVERTNDLAMGELVDGKLTRIHQ